MVNHAKKMGKNGFSILGDMGAFYFNGRTQDLVGYELSLPTKYDIDLKGFCLYHKDDFKNLTKEQKQNFKTSWYGYRNKTTSLNNKILTKSISLSYFFTLLEF